MSHNPRPTNNQTNIKTSLEAQNATLFTYTPERDLASITLPSGKTITYTYLKEHLTTQTTSETTTSYSYSYGCGGVLTEVHTDHGEGIEYSYDDLKRVTALHYTGTLNQTLSYANYHPLHNLPQSITYAGTTQTLSYDKDALLTQAGNYTLHRDPDSGQLRATE